MSNLDSALSYNSKDEGFEQALNDLLFDAFRSGYKRGAVDVATGVMQVISTESGYRLKGKESLDVSAGATGEVKAGDELVLADTGGVCEL